MALHVRPLSESEQTRVEKLAHSRTEAARLVERAQIVWLSSQGWWAPEIADHLGIHVATVRRWVKRFNEKGLAGFEDEPRSGRPPTYTPDEVAEVIAAALTKPDELGVPFGSWTLDRLAAYLDEKKGIPIKRSRIDEILTAEGLRWRTQETWFGERVDPDFAQKRGAIVTLYTAPPEGSLVVDIDEMGPESAKSFPGKEIVREFSEGPAVRAKQEIDYGRRGKGYIFGAFKPIDGEAFTYPYASRSSVNYADFLERVDAWISPEFSCVYAIMDNLSTHRATDVLLFALAHPRWEFVFQPKYAAYLNLIESWWKILRSLALKGRRFETWDDICKAIQEATAYWNAHRHPFLWGRRRRHQRRRPGIAQVPKVA